MAETTPGLRDLVLRAAADPEFAKQLISNPENFAKSYNLAPDAIDSIKRLGERGLVGEATIRRNGGNHYYG